MIGRKSFKWWKRVFFRLIELCVVNAMVLYFHKNLNIASTRRAHKYLREALVHQGVIQEIGVNYCFVKIGKFWKLKKSFGGRALRFHKYLGHSGPCCISQVP